MRCAADWPVRSVFRTSSLPQGGPQVLGANLKCSESEALGGLPLNMPPTPTEDSGSCLRRHSIFMYLCQASPEHFEQRAEFLPLRNRGLGPLAVPELPIPLARRAATTVCAAVPTLVYKRYG